MFTAYTYQDWLDTSESKRPAMLLDAVSKYKTSVEFIGALEASDYFAADNRAIAGKVLSAPRAITYKDENGRTRKRAAMEEIVGNRIRSSFLFRFVVQQNQFLLGNGVTIGKDPSAKVLGSGFDQCLQQAGERALLHGVCWGFYNVDHVEIIPAVTDANSGFFALLDDRTGAAMLGIQFWQLSPARPLYIRLFEVDGVTEYVRKEHELTIAAPKRAYRLRVATDPAGARITGADNYGGSLPVVPFFANSEHRSEFTPAIKSKIDLYDRILSDFGDNLDRANDVYWVLNNYGGTTDEIVEMLEEIHRIKAVATLSDGTGSSSTAEPRTIEVPHAARQAALELLQKALYHDYMALSMEELTGGSLTNVAIQTATANLNLKADRYEWQAASFVRGLLRLIGKDTEEIVFLRQTIGNQSEIVADISVMRDYIDTRTALELNPYIPNDKIDQILTNLDAQALSGAHTMSALDAARRGMLVEPDRTEI